MTERSSGLAISSILNQQARKLNMKKTVKTSTEMNKRS
jgi:hypothetical protein